MRIHESSAQRSRRASALRSPVVISGWLCLPKPWVLRAVKGSAVDTARGADKPVPRGRRLGRQKDDEADDHLQQDDAWGQEAVRTELSMVDGGSSPHGNANLVATGPAGADRAVDRPRARRKLTCRPAQPRATLSTSVGTDAVGNAPHQTFLTREAATWYPPPQPLVSPQPLPQPPLSSVMSGWGLVGGQPKMNAVYRLIRKKELQSHYQYQVAGGEHAPAPKGQQQRQQQQQQQQQQQTASPALDRGLRGRRRPTDSQVAIETGNTQLGSPSLEGRRYRQAHPNAASSGSDVSSNTGWESAEGRRGQQGASGDILEAGQHPCPRMLRLDSAAREAPAASTTAAAAATDTASWPATGHPAVDRVVRIRQINMQLRRRLRGQPREGSGAGGTGDDMRAGKSGDEGPIRVTLAAHSPRSAAPTSSSLGASGSGVYADGLSAELGPGGEGGRSDSGGCGGGSSGLLREALMSDLSRMNPVYRMIRKLELQQQHRPARHLVNGMPGGAATSPSSGSRGDSGTGVLGPAADPWASHDFEDVLLGGLMPPAWVGSNSSSSVAAALLPPDGPLQRSPRDLGDDLDPGVARGGAGLGDLVLELNSGTGSCSSGGSSWDVGDRGSDLWDGMAGCRAAGGLNPVLRLIRKKQLQRRLRLRGTLAAAADHADTAMAVAGPEHAADGLMGSSGPDQTRADTGSDLERALEIGPQDAVGGRAMFNPVYRLIRKKQLLRRRASRTAMIASAAASMPAKAPDPAGASVTVRTPAFTSAPVPQWNPSPGAFFDLMRPLHPQSMEGATASGAGVGSRVGSWLGPAIDGADAAVPAVVGTKLGQQPQLQLDPMADALDPMAAPADRAPGSIQPARQTERLPLASVVELTSWVGNVGNVEGGAQCSATAAQSLATSPASISPGGGRRVSEALADLMVGERAPMNHVYRLIRKKELQMQMRRRLAQAQTDAAQACSAEQHWEPVVGVKQDAVRLSGSDNVLQAGVSAAADSRDGKQQSSTASDKSTTAAPVVEMPEGRRQRIAELKERLRAKLLSDVTLAASPDPGAVSPGWDPQPAAANVGAGPQSAPVNHLGSPRLLTPGGLSNLVAAEQFRVVRSRLLTGGNRGGGASGNGPGLMRFLEEADEEAEAWVREQERCTGSSGGSGKSRPPSGAAGSSSSIRAPALRAATKPPPRYSGISQLWQAVGLQVGSHVRPLNPRSLEQLLQMEGVPASLASRVASSSVVVSRGWTPEEVLGRLQGLLQLMAPPACAPSPKPRPSLAKVAAAVAKQPNLLTRDVGGLNSNLTALADALRLDRPSAQSLALVWPSLLELRGQSLRGRLQALAAELGSTSPPQQHQQPQGASDEAGTSNAQAFLPESDADLDVAADVARRYPPALCLQPAAVGARVEALAAAIRTTASAVASSQFELVLEQQPCAGADTMDAAACTSVAYYGRLSRRRAVELLVAQPGLLGLSPTALASRWKGLAAAVLAVDADPLASGGVREGAAACAAAAVHAQRLVWRQQLFAGPAAAVARCLAASGTRLQRLRLVVMHAAAVASHVYVKEAAGKLQEVDELAVGVQGAAAEAQLKRRRGRPWCQERSGPLSLATVLAMSEERFAQRFNKTVFH